MHRQSSLERARIGSSARWLNRTVLGIGLASLFSDLSHETVTAALPALLASMGLAAAALGTIEGVADGLSSAAKLYGGWLTDRIARRKALCVSGYGAMALGTALIAAAGSWLSVLFGRGVMWIARGVRTPPRKALLAEAVSPATYGRAFGFERAMDTVGAVIAPLTALALLASGFSQRQILGLSVVPAFLAIAAIAWLVHETPWRIVNKTSFFSSFRGLPKSFLRILRGIGIFGAGDFAHSLMILYAVVHLTPSLGAAVAATASVGLYALHNVIYAAVSFPAGVLADLLNKRLLLSFTYVLGAFTAVLLALGISNLAGLAIVFALGGAYVGMEETLEDSLAAELLTQESRGTGFGLLAMINGLGDLASSVAVGWLWAAFGPATAFAYAAILMLAGSILTSVTKPSLPSN